VYGPVRTLVWQGSVGDYRPYTDLIRKGRAKPLVTRQPASRREFCASAGQAARLIRFRNFWSRARRMDALSDGSRQLNQIQWLLCYTEPLLRR
jgi:hypothetical protein